MPGVSSRCDAMTGRLGRGDGVFLVRASEFCRSCWPFSFTATVTEMWQAGQDSLLLFIGCGQQGECDGWQKGNSAETRSAKDAVVIHRQPTRSAKNLRR